MKEILITIAFLIMQVVPVYSMCPDGGPEPCGKFGGGYSSGCPDGGPPPCGRYGGGGCPDGGPPPCGSYGSGSGGSSSGGGSTSTRKPIKKGVVYLKNGKMFSGIVTKDSNDVIVMNKDGNNIIFLRNEVQMLVTEDQ